MLVATTGLHLQNNSYVWMCATLTNVPCWIVLCSIWKSAARSRAAALWVKSYWPSLDAPLRFLEEGEVCRWNSDAEPLSYQLETPKELEARRITDWVDRVEDKSTPRLRTRRRAKLQLDSSLGTWQERLEGRQVTILA